MMAGVTIVEFLLARIAEDEAAARGASTEGAYPHYGDTAAEECVQMARSEGCAAVGAAHLERWLPARVLAECEAKRRMVEEARDYSPELECGDNGEWVFGRALQWLAFPYSDHPDYLDEWRV